MLFNTHLDHVGQGARENGMALIRERMRRGNPKLLPAILMGDFNADPDNPVIVKLRAERLAEGIPDKLYDAYSASAEPPGLTAHSFIGGSAGKPIDYIFVSEQARVLNVQVVREQILGGYPSDHYPVLAQIRRPAVKKSSRKDPDSRRNGIFLLCAPQPILPLCALVRNLGLLP